MATSFPEQLDVERRESHCVAVLQTDINDNMRAILIDWLVEVHYKFRVSTLVQVLSSSHVLMLMQICRVHLYSFCCTAADARDSLPHDKHHRPLPGVQARVAAQPAAGELLNGCNSRSLCF